MLLYGCSHVDEKARKNISGVVTLNGQIVTQGDISFVPLETDAPPEASIKGGNAKIGLDGKYKLSRDLGLFKGKYQVRVVSGNYVHIKTNEIPTPGEFVRDPDSYRFERLVPEEYSLNSKLTATVGEDKNQTFDFNLENTSTKKNK